VRLLVIILRQARSSGLSGVEAAAVSEDGHAAERYRLRRGLLQLYCCSSLCSLPRCEYFGSFGSAKWLSALLPWYAVAVSCEPHVPKLLPPNHSK